MQPRHDYADRVAAEIRRRFQSVAVVVDHAPVLLPGSAGVANGEARPRAALADPRIKVRLADLGGTVIAGSPGDFGKLIAHHTEKWGKVIRAAGIKAE